MRAAAEPLVGPDAGGDVASDTWARVRDAVGRELPHPSFQRWLDQVVGVALRQGTLDLSVRGKASASWLDFRYRELITRVARREVGCAVRIRVQPDATVGGALVRLGLRDRARQRVESAPTPFALTDENRLAHAGLLRAAQAEVPEWPRMVVEGAPGVGKSHLAKVFRFARQRRHPTERWRASDALKLFEEYRRACRDREIGTFRGALLAHDGLVLDGLHALAHKVQFQELLAQVFEYFETQQRLVVCVLEPIPRSVRGFTPAFRSMLAGAVRLTLPELSDASRRSILERRAGGSVVPPWLLDDLASDRSRSLTTCVEQVREVQRLGHRLGRTPSRDEVAGEFPSVVRRSARRDPMDAILDRCADMVGASREAIVRGDRSRAAALGRHLAIYLALEVCDQTRETVRRWFPRLAPSVITYARRKIPALCRRESRYDVFLREVEQEVVHGQRLLF